MSQLRTNVRNFLLPMTEAEVQVELDLSIERGDTARAGYVEEFLCELQAENALCTGCYKDPCECGPDDAGGFADYQLA